MPQTPTPGRGQTLAPRRSGVPAFRAYRASVRPSAPLGPSAPLSSPTRNPGSTLGRTYPLKILATVATPMRKIRNWTKRGRGLGHVTYF